MQTADEIVGHIVEIQDGRYAGDTGLAVKAGKDELHIIVDLKEHGREEEFFVREVGIIDE